MPRGAVEKDLVLDRHALGEDAVDVAIEQRGQIRRVVQIREGLSQHRFGGFYTINEDRLALLPAATLERLHKAGYLAAIYFQIASLSNFRALIDRKNRKIAPYVARG